MKKYKIRLVGHSMMMVGISYMVGLLVYYYPIEPNINIWFFLTIFLIVVGLGLLISIGNKKERRQARQRRRVASVSRFRKASKGM